MNELKIKELLKECDGKTIIATTKYVDSSTMKELFNYGINNFAENRVNVFLNKYDELKDLNIIWHFIGHLQTNKVKKMINKIDYLHSLDSIKLAEEINKYRLSPLKCFIEIKLVDNDNKTGISEYELPLFIDKLKEYKNIDVVGLMVMADIDNEEEIKKVFHHAHELKEKYNLKYLSMGMSNDYKIALEEGSTHLRLGRILFN